MRLSKIQQKVVNLTKQGWKLKSTMGYLPDAWLRNENKNIDITSRIVTVSMSTLCALLDKKIIKQVLERYPFREYKLTKKQKNQKIS